MVRRYPPPPTIATIPCSTAWVGSYLSGGKTYQVLINGCTGKFQGDRPYSPIKIIFAVLALIALIAVIVLLVRARG